MTTTTTALQAPLFRGDKLEVVSIAALLGFLAASQLSVAPAYIMLAITLACWTAVVSLNHERIQVPPMFWWLAAYGAATIFSALNSVDPTVSRRAALVVSSRRCESAGRRFDITARVRPAGAGHAVSRRRGPKKELCPRASSPARRAS
jgi:hypothetical protein